MREDRGLRTFPHRRSRCLAAVGAGSAAAWKYGKPLAGATRGLADSGEYYGAVGGSRRYEPNIGLWGGWAWEEEIMRGSGALAQLRILGLLLLRGGLGYEPPLPRSSQGSDRGSDEP